MSWGVGYDELHAADVRSADRIVLRDGTRSVRHLQHSSATLRSGTCILWQRVFSFGRSAAVSGIYKGDRSGERRNQAEVSAHLADVVGNIVDSWRTSVQR